MASAKRARSAAADGFAARQDGDHHETPVIQLRTINGSLYELDLGACVWRRVARPSRSGDLRSEGGEIIALGPLRIGYSAGVLSQTDAMFRCQVPKPLAARLFSASRTPPASPAARSGRRSRARALGVTVEFAPPAEAHRRQPFKLFLKRVPHKLSLLANGPSLDGAAMVAMIESARSDMAGSAGAA
jgi:hypothetical protein